MAGKITIFTDGACLGNPGPGGYGVLIIQGDSRKELTGGFRLTTNNRMEIMAAIIGLQALNAPSVVQIYTDSKYLADSISLGWARSWKLKGWRKKDGKRTNWDLWEQLLDFCDRHEVSFIWVRGHAGNVENERCDFLSEEAARRDNLPADWNYEQARQPVQLQLGMLDP